MKLRTRATMLFDLLIGSLVALLVGSVLIQMMTATYTARSVITGQNVSQAEARKPLDVLADHLRNAWLFKDVNDVYSAIQAANTNDITYYTDSAGNTVRYRLVGTQLRRTAGGVETTVLDGVQSLTFTYYRAASYNSASWTVTAAPVASINLPALTAVAINATILLDGYVSSYTSVVRLRNSPRKTTL
jgi:hypothetical protein